MTEETPKPPKAPRPSPINGPAFLVFGFMFLLLGFGTDTRALIWPGIAFVLIAGLGYWLQKRYEKATGFEDVLPGGRPDFMPPQAPAEDARSANEESAAEERSETDR